MQVSLTLLSFELALEYLRHQTSVDSLRQGLPPTRFHGGHESTGSSDCSFDLGEVLPTLAPRISCPILCSREVLQRAFHDCAQWITLQQDLATSKATGGTVKRTTSCRSCPLSQGWSYDSSLRKAQVKEGKIKEESKYRLRGEIEKFECAHIVVKSNRVVYEKLRLANEMFSLQRCILK